MKMWIYKREDGCELEFYSASEEEAIELLKEFGIPNPRIDRLKEETKRAEPTQID
jgi:hypothetical protein